MRVRQAFLSSTLALLLAPHAGCFKGGFARDGAGCSDEGLCPPGQVCSADGQCLFPCPVAECVDDVCGCKTHLDFVEEMPYVCRADGLCHLLCGDGGQCGHQLVCGASGACLPSCGGGLGCPNGASCVGSPQPYCLSPTPAPDADHPPDSAIQP